MTRKTLLIALSICASLAAASASASLQRAITFDDKVENAEAIVMGRCLRTRSEWDPAHRWIVTYSTFKVEETMKGSAPQELTLVTPGGVIDGVRQESIGVRPFRQGDENVVFVKNTPAGPTVLYFDQGAYDVAADGRGDKVVVPFSTGAVLVDTQRGMAVAAEHPRTLNDFQRAVRTSIEHRDAQKMEVVRKAAAKEGSAWDALANYKALVALALIGIALSGWQLMKR